MPFVHTIPLVKSGCQSYIHAELFLNETSTANSLLVALLSKILYHCIVTCQIPNSCLNLRQISGDGAVMLHDDPLPLHIGERKLVIS